MIMVRVVLGACSSMHMPPPFASLSSRPILHVETTRTCMRYGRGKQPPCKLVCAPHLGMEAKPRVGQVLAACSASQSMQSFSIAASAPSASPTHCSACCSRDRTCGTGWDAGVHVGEKSYGRWVICRVARALLPLCTGLILPSACLTGRFWHATHYRSILVTAHLWYSLQVGSLGARSLESSTELCIRMQALNHSCPQQRGLPEVRQLQQLRHVAWVHVQLGTVCRVRSRGSSICRGLLARSSLASCCFVLGGSCAIFGYTAAWRQPLQRLACNFQAAAACGAGGEDAVLRTGVKIVLRSSSGLASEMCHVASIPLASTPGPWARNPSAELLWP